MVDTIRLIIKGLKIDSNNLQADSSMDNISSEVNL
mgnify:CR=1 FL=1